MSQISTANYFVVAFRRSGHETIICSDIADSKIDIVAHGLIDVDKLMRDHGFSADAVVFFEGGSMRLLPDTRRLTCCPAAWYAIDTHMDFDKHVHIGRLFDISFVAQKQYVAPLAARGVSQAQWLPLAFAPELLPSDEPSREIDIAYVGSENTVMHPERSALLISLKNYFNSTYFGQATPKEMGRIYASAKLVFNRTINNDVNMRFFEAMGAGAVLVTDRVSDNGAEDLFDENRHYVTYRNETELLETTRSLLADPDRLRAIGDAARSHILANHTYQHRADLLVSQLQSAALQVRPQASEIFAACLSLGLIADALYVAGEAMGSVGGGRFARIFGTVSKGWILAAAAIIARVEWLRQTLRVGLRA